MCEQLLSLALKDNVCHRIKIILHVSKLCGHGCLQQGGAPSFVVNSDNSAMYAPAKLAGLNTDYVATPRRDVKASLRSSHVQSVLKLL